MEPKQAIGIILFTIFLLCSGFYIGWEYHDDMTVRKCNSYWLNYTKVNCYDHKENTPGYIPEIYWNNSRDNRD